MRTFDFRRRLLAVVVPIAVASGITMIMVFPTSSGASGSSVHRPGDREATIQPSGSTSGPAAFSILDRPATSADKQNQVIVGAASHDSDLQPSAARVLATNQSGTLWLVPKSNGELCLSEQPSANDGILLASACSTDSEALTHGILLGTRGQLFGGVPDGVPSVTATLKDGSTTVVAVHDNSYQLPQTATAVHFVGPQGSVQLAIPSQIAMS